VVMLLVCRYMVYSGLLLFVLGGVLVVWVIVGG